MTIMSEDGQTYTDVGTSEMWNTLYSTVTTKLTGIKANISLALRFLETGTCQAENCIETAKELNLIRDKLSQLPVSELVYDYKKPTKKVPWMRNISPIVTSCGNFFTTADGKDLIFELNSVLCYASVMNISVICQ